jgi:prenyltransferase beta subunit
MLMGLLLVAATNNKKTGTVEFDFKKTSAYIHERDSRPDFPVSVTLARSYVYSVLVLGEKIDPKRKETIVDFIKKLQREDGGFTIDPATKTTNSLYTDFALETLSYLGAANAIDAGKVKSYLSSLKRPDGGFSFDAKAKESSFQTTYYAVHILSYLNDLNIIDKEKTAAYIKDFERKDTGGFNYVRGTGIANAQLTYMGVFTLKTLGMLDEQTKKSAIKFLISTPFAGKQKKYDVTQTLEEQVYAIVALKMLGAENKIKKEGVITFIKSFYIPVNGGFGPIHGYGSAPDPTYFGIRGLAEIGILKTPAESSLK